MKSSSDKPKRVLSIFVLIMLNVSIMASLRNLPLVAEFGLSAIFFFLIVALFFLIPCALISAELATGWPKSGGVYIWVREALGDHWGFFAIWMQWIHNVAWYPVILSFVAGTLAYLISPSLAQNKFFILSVILLGFWGMTFFNYFGIKTSSWFSTIGVIAGTIAPGILIISLGMIWILGKHPIQMELSWHALIPEFRGISDLVFLAGLFLAFAGLEVSAGYASDVKNPRKNYPIAIVLAAIITFSLFMLGSLAIGAVIPKTNISFTSGLMDACAIFFQYYQLTWILPILAFLLVIGAIAEVNSWLIGPVKGLYATSIHGNLPPFFQKVNKRNVPTRLLLFQAIIVSIAGFIFLYMPNVSGAFWILTALSAQSYLIMYILMFLSAIVLRYSKPHVPRAYKVPFKNKGIWLFGSLGILTSLFVIILAFVPPAQLNTGNPWVYRAFLACGLTFMCGIPFLIYTRHKPSWIQKKH